MRDRIADTQAAYARCIDDDRLEAWPAFFHERCTYRVTTAANHRAGLEGAVIWADSRGMLTDRVSALREANIYERHAYRHILGLPGVLAEGPEGLRTETSFLVIRIMRAGESEIFATGRYLDLWQPDATGAPLLAERVVVCDSPHIDTLLALPL